MKSVEEVLGYLKKSLQIEDKYGSDTILASKLGMKGAALTNWKHRGAVPWSTLERVLNADTYKQLQEWATGTPNALSQKPSKGQDFMMVQDAVDAVIPGLDESTRLEIVMLALDELAELRVLGRPDALRKRIERWAEAARLLAAQNASQAPKPRATGAPSVKPKP